MRKSKLYKCVNCGEEAGALYKTYGPSVLKLTKCEQCGRIVDKYVEYDPVIVMIDLVLMSREAQRHVIYNTEFKPYWKLFIILMMLETYGIWRNDSLITIGINAICYSGKNSSDSTQLSVVSWLPASVLESWRENCWAWTQPERVDETDLFIWEKDFYIQFISTFCGIAVFLVTTYSLMKLGQYFGSLHRARVPPLVLVKAFSLAHMSTLFTLPMLVWGNADTPPRTRHLHYSLVFAYSGVLFYNVFTVVYGCHMLQTILVLAVSNYAKFQTTFNTTPYVRKIVS